MIEIHIPAWVGILACILDALYGHLLAVWDDAKWFQDWKYSLGTGNMWESTFFFTYLAQLAISYVLSIIIMIVFIATLGILGFYYGIPWFISFAHSLPIQFRVV
jgi:DMSO/TMAO reductase YedYZ heme-binding membrane subunit